MQTFTVKPEIQKDVTVGTEGNADRVFIGKLAEAGGNRRIWFNATKEFVVLIIGKRGSGKSYALGSLLEGFATESAESAIGMMSTRRAVLLLDPMGNFWTTAVRVKADGTPKVRQQYEELRRWNLEPPNLNVNVWMPAGFGQPTDHPGIQQFHVRPGDLDAQDWADVLGLNLMRDPQGLLLAEAFDQLVQTRGDEADYDVADLVSEVDTVLATGAYAADTARALKRSLGRFARLPVFRRDGTKLTDLLRPGHLSILMLPVRVGHDLRRVVTRMLIRRVLREREIASQIRQRLQIEVLPDSERAFLERELERRIPRTVFALDEAQELLGEGAGDARVALEDFCLLGRNYGLSLVLATQRPTASALSPKVRSQVDTCMIHRLLTQEDIEIVRKNLLAPEPFEIKRTLKTLGIDDVLRRLDTGQALVTSSHVDTGSDDNVRSFIMYVRPRVTVHGGEIL
jgi:hypothetical protein